MLADVVRRAGAAGLGDLLYYSLVTGGSGLVDPSGPTVIWSTSDDSESRIMCDAAGRVWLSRDNDWLLIDGDNGSEIWAEGVDDAGSGHQTPANDPEGNSYYVATGPSTDQIRSVDVNGTRRWSQSLSHQHSAAINTEWLYVGRGSGSLQRGYARVDPETGSSSHRSNPDDALIRGVACIPGGNILIGTNRGNVLRMDEPGSTSTLWKTETHRGLSAVIQNLAYCHATGFVYAIGQNSSDPDFGRIAQVDAETGDLGWTRNQPSQGRGIAVNMDGTVVYGDDGNDSIIALDGLDGSLLWSLPMGGDPRSLDCFPGRFAISGF